jgi:hypothetical protein
MTRFSANKKLNALDRKIDVLEAECRKASSAPSGDLERQLLQLREQRHLANLEYLEAIVAETRAKLDDLKSDALGSGWRRAIWWDILTIFWFVAGAGWLVWRWPGVLAGTLATAACGAWIARQRRQSRPTFIRQGEDKLRASQAELEEARRQVPAAVPVPVEV